MLQYDKSLRRQEYHAYPELTRSLLLCICRMPLLCCYVDDVS